MAINFENPHVFRKAIILVFSLCFIYWAYLMGASDMSIQCDAIGYEKLGEMIQQQGWSEYFRTGPNREPFYPFTISISMRLADCLSFPYQYVQKGLQVGMLFISQILFLILMGKLKIHNSIKLLMTLYMGFSPALVNSAFSLYSEIAIYPFVLALVLFVSLSWKAVHCDHPKKIILLAILTALAVALATFVKGVFQVVFLFVLIPFALRAIYYCLKKNKQAFLNSLCYLIVNVLVAAMCIGSYMSMNKEYNGNFQLTDRYAATLFGNAHKKTQEVTPRILLAHVANIPGQGFCRNFFSEEECRYTEHYLADHYKASLLPKLMKDIPENERNSATLRLAINEIKERPFQFLLFMVYEALRMPFWESTQVGFVDYPVWLSNLFSTKWFKNGLRLGISLLTILSFFFVLLRTYRERSFVFDYTPAGERVQIRFFVLLVIISFTGLYSLCFVLTRYAFPIVPLYLLGIACFLDNIFYMQQSGG